MAPIPPRPLVKSLREGRCVLFVGSGLSAWAKLPTWPQLLQDIAEEMRADEPDQPESLSAALAHRLTQGPKSSASTCTNCC